MILFGGQRVVACAAVSLLLVGAAPVAATADPSVSDAMGTQVARPASDALRPAEPDITAQAVPVGEPHAPVSRPSLPRGLSYTADASFAYPFGSIGYDARFPGGVDAVVGYGFSRTLRIQAGYYQLQEYPVGFNTGVVPLYLQGFAPAIGALDLRTTGMDATIKNTIVTAVLQNLVVIGGRIPIVISPSYLARSGTVGGHSDELPVEIGGFPQTVHVRSFQAKLIAFTLPFLSTPRLFGTYTIAPQWLVNTNGANQTNHPQLFQLLYLEYRATRKTTFFFQPSLLPNYLPPDPYPQHLLTSIYGVAYKFTPLTFGELEVSEGTPLNRSPYGITSVTCLKLPCAPTQVAPSLGGLHAAQVQLLFGIGSPSVIPL